MLKRSARTITSIILNSTWLISSIYMPIMGGIIRILFLVLCYLLALGQHRCGLVQSQNLCSSSDLSGLEQLKKGFVLDSSFPLDWFSSTSTSSATHCCHWVGITCDSDSRVVELNLSGRGLKGSISVGASASLDLSLRDLTLLDLSNNFLTGTIPSVLFRLPNLRVIQLSRNKLVSGGINPVVSSKLELSSLEIFNVSFNRFSGSFLEDLFSVVGSKLRILDVSNNGLDGMLNISIVCSGSPKIEILYLSGNSLSGHFPPMGFEACYYLRKIRLDSNYISGSLQADLFRMKSLEELHLQGNLLAGIVGPGFAANLSNLVHLDISSNRFSGELPDVLGNLTSLQCFSASSNRISGNLPYAISTLTSLRILNLNNNSLTGDIPKNFNFSSDLIHLDLGGNGFTGEIPPIIGNLSDLKTLNLATNRFGGDIPESFGNLSRLNFLSLFNNSLSNISHSLQILQHCSHLDTLILDINFGGESLSGSILMQGYRNLQILAIANSQLSGRIPSWLRKCKKLNVLDLSGNRLTGEIPEWFGELNSLFYIDLSHNLLVGELPKNMSNMWSMTYHNTSRLSFSPTPPDYFTFYSGDDGGGNNDGKMKLYKRLNKIPPSLILRSNNLTGPIWPEFGKLANLHVIDLSRNHLSGTIPEELGGIICLEILNLSYNSLTGTIPSSLSRLSFLSVFQVGYNELVGTIPSGGQFPTFPKSSYEGNLGLLSGDCFPQCDQWQAVSGEGEGEDEDEDEDEIVGKYGLPFEIGLSVGFLATFLFMLIRS